MWKVILNANTFIKALKISLCLTNSKNNTQSRKVQFCVSMTYFQIS